MQELGVAALVIGFAGFSRNFYMEHVRGDYKAAGWSLLIMIIDLGAIILIVKPLQ